MFENTKKAIEFYDSRIGRLKKEMDEARTNERVYDAEHKMDQLLDTVHRAFFLDTAKVNSLEHCMVADLSYMRACVRGDSGLTGTENPPQWDDPSDV